MATIKKARISEDIILTDMGGFGIQIAFRRRHIEDVDADWITMTITPHEAERLRQSLETRGS
jgi:hypothetical protein